MVAQCIYAMWGMFARRVSLSAPVIKHGKFVLSFYSILLNVCMYRKWCEGISDTTAVETSHPLYARPNSGTVRAFISVVDSFRYRQLTAVIRDKCCSDFTLLARFPPRLNALYYQYGCTYVYAKFPCRFVSH
jgi:hypothetical protein